MSCAWLVDGLLVNRTKCGRGKIESVLVSPQMNFPLVVQHETIDFTLQRLGRLRGVSTMTQRLYSRHISNSHAFSRFPSASP